MVPMVKLISVAINNRPTVQGMALLSMESTVAG